MAKSKYKQGKYYECERCGNIIKICHEGGGNIICCVKALNETSTPAGESAGGAAPAAAAAPAAKAAPAAAAKPVVKPAAAIDAGKILPVDIFGVRVDRGEDDLAMVFKKQLFATGAADVELLRLNYGQEDLRGPVEKDTVLALMEGRGVFFINGRECQVTTGATVLVPTGVKEGIKNTMPDEMVVLRIQSG